MASHLDAEQKKLSYILFWGSKFRLVFFFQPLSRLIREAEEKIVKSSFSISANDFFPLSRVIREAEEKSLNSSFSISAGHISAFFT